MKLQLDENTLNAYINEAIRQELNEMDESLLGKVGKGIGKAAKGVGRAVRKAGRGVGRYGRALGGNKKSVKSLEGELSKLRGQLDDVVKQQKALWGKEGSGMAGHELVKQERGLRAAIERGEKALMQAKAGKTLARTATGAATAAGVGGYLLGNQHGKNVGGGDLDAPWNPPEDGNGDNGGNGNGDGWNGEFPWDDVQPRWTPKPKKKQPQPNPITPKKPSIMDTPLEKVDTSKMNLPGQVSQLNAPGLSGDRPVQQPTVAQSAIHTMTQTTNANDNRPLQGRADLNRRTAANAKDIINQNVQNGNMSRQDARGQKQQINQARRDLNRTGQPISN